MDSVPACMLLSSSTFDFMDYSTLNMRQMESLVLTFHQESLLQWVFDNCEYWVYEHLCFITGDAG